jgi:hypothetical protein
VIYKPKHFRIEEFFPAAFLAAQKPKGDLVWGVMDPHVLVTCDRLRERYGPLQGNDYYRGGNFSERGYRPPGNKTNAKLSISQHLFGRAQDLWPGEVTAEEIRQEILKKPELEAFEFITCIEMGVNWLHFDVRNWDKGKSGILRVTP